MTTTPSQPDRRDLPATVGDTIRHDSHFPCNVTTVETLARAVWKLGADGYFFRLHPDGSVDTSIDGRRGWELRTEFAPLTVTAVR